MWGTSPWKVAGIYLWRPDCTHWLILSKRGWHTMHAASATNTSLPPTQELVQSDVTDLSFIPFCQRPDFRKVAWAWSHCPPPHTCLCTVSKASHGPGWTPSQIVSVQLCSSLLALHLLSPSLCIINVLISAAVSMGVGTITFTATCSDILGTWMMW